jgi:hypothetical protein
MPPYLPTRAMFGSRSHPKVTVELEILLSAIVGTRILCFLIFFQKIIIFFSEEEKVDRESSSYSVTVFWETAPGSSKTHQPETICSRFND